MTFRHPALRAKDRAAYGDGMFFFTRPVGAPDDESLATYGDGMFFFTQPVGAPDRIRPGTYGAAGAGALKGGAGALRGSLTKSTGSRAAPAISAETYAAFEKAAFDVGVWQFWTAFWRGGQGPATGGTRAQTTEIITSQTGESQAQLAEADARFAAAKAALEAARAKVLKGVSSDARVLRAFAVYESTAIARGWYSQAFRNLTSAGRKKSQLLLDTLKRETEGRSEASVAVAQAYLLADAQSDATADDYESAVMGKLSLKQKGESEKDYQARQKSHAYKRGLTRTHAAKIFSSTLESKRSDLRTKQVASNSALPAALSSTKASFEEARSAAYAAKTLDLPTRAPGTSRTTTTDTSTTDTTVTETPADTGVTETPSVTTDYVTTTPDTSGGAALPDITGGPPEGAQTLEVKDVEMKQVALPEKGPTEETFFSKNKVVIGLVAVAAIGGGYWWYTNKYLPSKAAGR